MLNVSDLLEQIKQSPYREIEVKAPHTGEIAFADIKPGDKAELHDPEYEYKDGAYYVRAVETEFSSEGGRRTVELGYRLL